MEHSSFINNGRNKMKNFKLLFIFLLISLFWLSPISITLAQVAPDCKNGKVWRQDAASPIGDCRCAVGLTPLLSLTRGNNSLGVCGLSFKPSDITGSALRAWFDADDESTMFTSNTCVEPTVKDLGTVGCWKDKSGFNRHATQVTATKRPVFSTTAMGGLPGIDFDGTDDGLSLATAPLVAGDYSFTYIVVWKTDSTSTAQVLFDQNTGSTLTSNARASMLIVNTTYGYNGEGNDAYTLETIAMGTKYLSIMQINSTNVSLYTNGLNKSATLSAVPNISGNAAGIGYRVLSTPIGFLNGQISEIIVYDKVLSAIEMNGLKNYLSYKWGIAIP